MIWWLVIFGGIALVALIGLIAGIVWLAHKASDVWSEARWLGRQLEELAALAGQIGEPAATSARSVAPVAEREPSSAAQ